MDTRRHAMTVAVGLVGVLLLGFSVWCVRLMVDVGDLRDSLAVRVSWLQDVHRVQTALDSDELTDEGREFAGRTLATITDDIAADPLRGEELLRRAEAASRAVADPEIEHARARSDVADLVPAIRSETAELSIELGKRWDSINIVAAISIILAGATLTLLVYVRFVLLRRAERTMTTLQTHLRDADRLAAVGTLAAGVAHEINNPMSYVLGNLEELRERLREDAAVGERAQRILEEALQGANRATRIVRDLRMVAQPPAEEDAAANIEQVIESTLRIAAAELKGPIRVKRDFSGAPRVHGSETRWGQVMLNLVLNAAHAMREGGELELRTRHSIGGPVIVEVRDEGPGIPAEIYEHAFEPFVTTKVLGEGTGLGLFVCHNIVTALGGKIELLTSPEGTLARLELEPARESDPGEEPVELGTRKARVLIVDDEELVSSALARTLSHCSVTRCNNAESALKTLEHQRFDVVLCDLMMPGADGTELFARATERDPDLASRFVFMTGGAGSETSRRAARLSGRACLEKPLSPGIVREAVARVLDA